MIRSLMMATHSPAKKNAPKGVFLPASLSLSSWHENSFGF
jgi:hypothetical protein